MNHAALMDAAPKDAAPKDPDSAGVLGTLLSLAGVALLVALAFGSVSRSHRLRCTARPQPLPEKLQVWEGEGGQNPIAEPLH